MSSASRGLAPREGLECLLVKMCRMGPLAEPRRGPQAGKSRDPYSQNADKHHRRYIERCISSGKLLKRKVNIEPSFMLKVFATLGQCLWMIDRPSFDLFRNTSILNRGCCMKTFLAS